LIAVDGLHAAKDEIGRMSFDFGSKRFGCCRTIQRGLAFQ
jgi:hypothetical protein